MDGKVTLDVSQTIDIVSDLAIDADGRIVVIGDATEPDYSAAQTTVARINADGSPDTAFGIGGMTVTDLPGAYDTPRGLALVSDGGVPKIVVVSGVSHSTSIRLARYSSEETNDDRLPASIAVHRSAVQNNGSSDSTKGGGYAQAGFGVHSDCRGDQHFRRYIASRGANVRTTAAGTCRLVTG